VAGPIYNIFKWRGKGGQGRQALLCIRRHFYVLESRGGNDGGIIFNYVLSHYVLLSRGE
jgi:hypothetical protein